MKSGIIAVHKPIGISSAAVVARVKRSLGVKKVGHTGTLDPFATGLLLCAINQGTRISRFFLDGHKRYTAKLHLGIETDTYDLTGRAESVSPEGMVDALSDQEIKDAVRLFSGVIDQVAPSFSALKHNGQPLYKLARQGKMIQKPPRKIEIFSIDILSIQRPYVDIEVHCSSGTYIRSLAFDIGRKLGCGAHLAALCRTESSHFNLTEAVELEVFESLDKDQAYQRLVSLSDCLGFIPSVRAEAQIVKKIQFGQKLFKGDLDAPLLEPGDPLRVVDDHHRLLAIIQMDENLQNYNYSCVFAS